MTAPGSASGNVQSVERAFQLLEVLADNGGVLGVSAIAEIAGQSRPTVHRSLRTLVSLGYVRQEPSRRYALGPRLMRLGESSAKMLSAWGRPHLRRLAEQVGESANLAMLDGDLVVYVAHQPSQHPMRLFTEVGSRVLPHGTGVGKAILSTMEWADVQRLVERTGLPAHTDRTITDVARLEGELERITANGYAIDAEEHEVGVRCVAVAVPAVSTRLAISVSGPSVRMTTATLDAAVPLLTEAAGALSRDLNHRSSDD